MMFRSGLATVAKQYISMINRRLHFMFGLWDTGPIPKRFADNLETWNRALPQLSVKVWNRRRCFELLKKYHELSWVFQLRPVQQADVVRLLVIYDQGGWYNDLDTRPIPDTASTWESCSGKDLAVITENICDAKAVQMTCHYRYREGVPEDPVRIANFSFAAAAKSAFLWKCIRLADERRKRFPSGSDDYYPIFTTGPDVITTVYHAAKPDSSLLLSVGQWCAHAENGTWRNCRA
jgi:Glycosyltransferase sugar-binding region containing DXD motif